VTAQTREQVHNLKKIKALIERIHARRTQLIVIKSTQHAEAGKIYIFQAQYQRGSKMKIILQHDGARRPPFPVLQGKLF
jgi:hypothetical protein